MLALSFYFYFHIHSSNMSISFINAKLGVVQGVVHYFLQQSLCDSFVRTPMEMLQQNFTDRLLNVQELNDDQ